MSDSNLVKHVKNELRLIGYDVENPDTDDLNGMMSSHIIEIAEIFSKQGHSGASGEYAIQVLEQVLRFKNLTPLTTDPAEWVEVGPEMWQNKRSSDAFSDDGGKTYKRLGDDETIHESKLAQE